MINIGLLGLGTVGMGVVKILEERKEEFARAAGEKVAIKKILVRSIEKSRKISVDENLLTLNAAEILNDPGIHIIIEVTGDVQASYEYITQALSKAKHVVSANKAVIAKYFEEFCQLSVQHGVSLLYEGAVGGGMPVLKTMKEQARLNTIERVDGIINGSCNYLLTSMFKDEKGFDEMVSYCLEQGYLEADPSDDLEGWDSRRKLRILATLAFNTIVREEEIPCQGIAQVKDIDAKILKGRGRTLKLLGSAFQGEKTCIAVVEPVALPAESSLAHVDYANNSVVFNGENVQEVRIFGSGAGMLPTANAVLCDVMDIITNTAITLKPSSRRLLNGMENFEGRYYVRMSKEKSEALGVNAKPAYPWIEEWVSVNEYWIFFTKRVSRQVLIEAIKNASGEDYFMARIED